MMQLLPFTVRGKDFAVDLSSVRGAGLLPKVCFVPQSRPPSAGIILHRGELMAVWNSCLFAGQSIGFLGDFRQYLQVDVGGKTIALPVERVGSAMEHGPLWTEQNFYGLRIFRRIP